MRPVLTAPLKLSSRSRQLCSRRAALMAGGAGVAAALLPESVRGQQDTRSGTDLRAILSRMTLADICITNEGTEMLGKVFDRLMKAAASERLTPHRLDEAVLRNLKFMEWLGLFGTDARVSPDRARRLLSDEQDNRFLAGIVGTVS